MSEGTLRRKNFNGGEISPELHFRSDLEAYYNSCKSLRNLQVTPWGGVRRRPPTRVLHAFDVAKYGKPIKYIPFRFSSDDTFHLIFTDNGGTEAAVNDDIDLTSLGGSTDLQDYAGLLVLGENGDLQPVSGQPNAENYLLGTYILAGVVDRIHFVNINDVIYMTAGGQHPPVEMFRYTADFGQNRWRFKRFAINAGPFSFPNDDSDVRAALIFEDHTGFSQVGQDGSAGNYYDDVGVPSEGDIRPRCMLSIFHDAQDGSKKPFITELEQLRNVRGNLTVKLPRGILRNPPYTIDGSTPDPATTAGADWQYFEGIFNTDTINATGTTSLAVHAGKRVILTTIGSSWQGTLVLQESTDLGDTWEDIGYIRSYEGDFNGSIERTLQDPVQSLVRVKIEDYVELDGNVYEEVGCRWRMEPEDTDLIFEAYEVVGAPGQNTSYDTEYRLLGRLLTPGFNNPWTYNTDGTLKDPTAVAGLPNGVVNTSGGATTEYNLGDLFTTPYWALSEYNPSRGYPNTLAIHEERLWFGGTPRRPTTVWASRVNDWHTFSAGDTDADGFALTLQADTFDSIVWMRSTRRLLVGTEINENSIEPINPDLAISPTNVKAVRHTFFGSNFVQAVVTADLVFFTQKQARRVRSVQYDFGMDQYITSEMSILADHINESGIREACYSRHPFSFLFFTLRDGTATMFTYERENQVQGWARFELSAGRKIVSANRNFSSAGDIIGMIVEGGSELYTFEIMTAEATVPVYIDAYQRASGTTTLIDNIPAPTPEDLVVVQYAEDSASLSDSLTYTIAEGSGGLPYLQVSIDGEIPEGVEVYAGLRSDFVVEPTDFIQPGDFGPRRRATQLNLYLVDSAPSRLEVNGSEVRAPARLVDAPSGPIASNLDSDLSLYTGELTIPTGGQYAHSLQVRMFDDHPGPFYLAGLGWYDPQAQSR